MLTKFASLEVGEILEIKGSAERISGAGLDKISSYSDYRTDDGYLYTRVRAISSRVNKNHDGWPSEELAKSYHTFIGKPIFVDHNNSDPSRARGVVVDAKLHIENDSQKAAALDPYYANAPDNHKPPTWVELLLEVDAKQFPKLAKAIISDDIDGVSMGANVERSKCSHCHNWATTPEEYCTHVMQKGASFDRFDDFGVKTSSPAYEDCYDIGFFEISYVFDPADETALDMGDKRHSISKVAANPGNHDEQGDIEINPMTSPQFPHDCDNCRFQGQADAGYGPADVYSCNGQWVARKSADPPDYVSMQGERLDHLLDPMKRVKDGVRPGGATAGGKKKIKPSVKNKQNADRQRRLKEQAEQVKFNENQRNVRERSREWAKNDAEENRPFFTEPAEDYQVPEHAAEGGALGQIGPAPLEGTGKETPYWKHPDKTPSDIKGPGETFTTVACPTCLGGVNRAGCPTCGGAGQVPKEKGPLQIPEPVQPDARRQQVIDQAMQVPEDQVKLRQKQKNRLKPNRFQGGFFQKSATMDMGGFGGGAPDMGGSTPPLPGAQNQNQNCPKCGGAMENGICPTCTQQAQQPAGGAQGGGDQAGMGMTGGFKVAADGHVMYADAINDEHAKWLKILEENVEREKRDKLYKDLSAMDDEESENELDELWGKRSAVQRAIAGWLDDPDQNDDTMDKLLNSGNYHDMAEMDDTVTPDMQATQELTNHMQEGMTAEDTATRAVGMSMTLEGAIEQLVKWGMSPEMAEVYAKDAAARQRRKESEPWELGTDPAMDMPADPFLSNFKMDKQGNIVYADNYPNIQDGMNDGMFGGDPMWDARQWITEMFPKAAAQVDNGSDKFIQAVIDKHYPGGWAAFTEAGTMDDGTYARTKTAEAPLPQSMMTTAPEKVDTLRQEKVCEVCGSDMEDGKCAVCGYEVPPEGFDNPDLEKAQQVAEMGAEAPGGPGGEPPPGVMAPPGGAGGGGGAPGAGAGPPPPGAGGGAPMSSTRKSSETPAVTSERTAGKIRENEQPILPATKTVSDHPKTTQVVKEPTRLTQSKTTAMTQIPTTEQVAAEMVKRGTFGVKTAAEATALLEEKGLTRLLAANPASDPAEHHQEVDQVGGEVDNPLSDIQHIDVEKQVDIESIPTKTWSGEKDQHSPVTPDAGELGGPIGTKANVKESDTSQSGIFGDEIAAEKQIDVEKPLQPEFTKGPETQTFKSDDFHVGDPVTTEAFGGGGPIGTPLSAYRSKIVAHAYASLHIAEQMVEQGLVPADSKFELAAQLEQESPEELAVRRDMLSKTKTASFRGPQRTAAAPKLSKLVNSSRETGVSHEVEDTNLGDSALFGR